MKILFQGDSVTDAGRSADGIGKGYVKYAIEFIRKKFPDVEFEFVNKGVGGNQTKDLVARLQEDFIDVGADIVSILIGVNDTWHHMNDREFVPDGVFESNYRTVLSAVKATGAKIMMIEPYVVSESRYPFYEDLFKKILIERKLAREFADVYMPLDGLLAQLWTNAPATDFSDDGVHPNTSGSRIIGKLYCDYISPLIEELK